MYCIIVHRFTHTFAAFEHFDVLNHKLCVKRRRVVIVYLAALFKSEMVKNIIIVIVVDNGYVIFKSLHKRCCKSSFSAAGASGDTYYKHFSTVPQNYFMTP